NVMSYHGRKSEAFALGVHYRLDRLDRLKLSAFCCVTQDCFTSYHTPSMARPGCAPARRGAEPAFLASTEGDARAENSVLSVTWTKNASPVWRSGIQRQILQVSRWACTVALTSCS